MITNTRRRKLNTKSAPKFFGPTIEPSVPFYGLAGPYAAVGAQTIADTRMKAGAICTATLNFNAAEDSFANSVGIFGATRDGAFDIQVAGSGFDTPFYVAYSFQNP